MDEERDNEAEEFVERMGKIGECKKEEKSMVEVLGLEWDPHKEAEKLKLIRKAFEKECENRDK